ncbi:MAG: response regulator [Thermodesulfovibrionales bacterium]|nr:response regulator [Thermodesulfovibrionales bacterium]
MMKEIKHNSHGFGKRHLFCLLSIWTFLILLPVADGEDAIAKYDEYKQNIDMVILDLLMPKKNGRDIYRHIKETRPDIKALFISGYTKDMLTSKGIYEEGLEFISKPLESRSFMHKVRSILNKRQ